jgi:hypothetical protein
MMELFHRLYLDCLAGMGACFLLSGGLFIRMDIRSAIGILGGYRMKKRKHGMKNAEFQMERELLLIHTNEVIEKGGAYR